MVPGDVAVSWVAGAIEQDAERTVNMASGIAFVERGMGAACIVSWCIVASLVSRCYANETMAPNGVELSRLASPRLASHTNPNPGLARSAPASC